MKLTYVYNNDHEIIVSGNRENDYRFEIVFKDFGGCATMLTCEELKELANLLLELIGTEPKLNLTDAEIEKWAFDKYHEVEDSLWFEPLQVGAKWVRDNFIGTEPKEKE